MDVKDADRPQKSSLHWRHNERDGVSNHQPHDCLLNGLFRRRSRKHQSSASLSFVRGIHRWSVNSPHKGPVTRKMFPFDDVIMVTLKKKPVVTTFPIDVLLSSGAKSPACTTERPWFAVYQWFRIMFYDQMTLFNKASKIVSCDFFILQKLSKPVGCSIKDIRPKLITKSSPITSVLVIQSFWNFAQSAAVSLSRPV